MPQATSAAVAYRGQASLVLSGAWCALSAYPQIRHVDVLIGLALNFAIPFLAAFMSGDVSGFRSAAAC